MTIDKAIEILTINNDHNPTFTDAEREQALQLGIEALNRIITSRHSKHHNYKRLLPGETE